MRGGRYYDIVERKRSQFRKLYVELSSCRNCPGRHGINSTLRPPGSDQPYNLEVARL